MTEQHAEFDLAELAAEAAQRDAAARAAAVWDALDSE